jgi:hypothetical protein
MVSLRVASSRAAVFTTRHEIVGALHGWLFTKS